MPKKKEIIPNLPITEWFELERNMEIVARMSTERELLSTNAHQVREPL